VGGKRAEQKEVKEKRGRAKKGSTFTGKKARKSFGSGEKRLEKTQLDYKGDTKTQKKREKRGK